MLISIEIDEKQFDDSVTKEGIEALYQDIADRYNNNEYFNQDILNNFDHSCPNCGTSDYDGYCSWCKKRAGRAVNWYKE